ncbi:DUF899 family protein [soil metagenome]
MTTQTTLYPNETAEYRTARDRLLEAEIELRSAIEHVARMRRALPPGPVVSEDYVFSAAPRDPASDGPSKPVRLSELFADGRDDLILINYMYGPNDDGPCPMCTMWADGYDAIALYIEQRAGFALLAATGIENLRRLARDRGWRNLRLLSSHGTTFNVDYHVETEDGGQIPGVMVFHRDPDGTIRLHHAAKMMMPEKFTPPAGEDPRGIDLYSPVWQLFDLLPGGRGDWYPSLANQPDWYEEAVRANQAMT